MSVNLTQSMKMHDKEERNHSSSCIFAALRGSRRESFDAPDIPEHIPALRPAAALRRGGAERDCGELGRSVGAGARAAPGGAAWQPAGNRGGHPIQLFAERPLDVSWRERSLVRTAAAAL